jgi:hypothetical protein
MRRSSLVLLLSLACGPKPTSEGDDASSAGEASGGTSTGGTSTGGTSTGGSAPTTGTGDATASGDEVTSSACDGRGGARLFDLGFPVGCDVLAQDCPVGEKCAPRPFDPLCGPLDPCPLAVGEACTTVNDRDPCVQGAVCGDRLVDELAVCIALCDPGAPACAAGERCVELPPDFGVGGFGWCLRGCDPRLEDCGAGEECTAVFADFPVPWISCLPDKGEVTAGEFCDPPSLCGDGLACVAEGLAPCAIEALPCCTPFCDLDAPACPDGLTCAPWSDPPQPGLESLGVCLSP